MSVEFRGWPKIGRPKDDNILITEKMDGTNGCIIIEEGKVVGVQSRNRLIDRHNDNMGFANWVFDNQEELSTLGDGYHYGEWCGPKIQQNPHNLEKKTFFLFNVHHENTPECVEVVRVLYNGPKRAKIELEMLEYLNGLSEFEGYRPEGIVAYHYLFKQRVKWTYRNQEGKWKKDE